MIRLKALIVIYLIFSSFDFSQAWAGNNMKHEYTFEVNFPFEDRELGFFSAPVITATLNGKVIFNKASWSHPVTEVPARVGNLKSVENMIALHVKVENGPEKKLSVDLKKGVYLFIYFDLKKNDFILKQQVDPPGYD